MSYIPSNPVIFNQRYLAGGTRLQVANPEQIFENRHNYGINPLLWETVDNVNGTVSHIAAEAGVSMSIPGNSGDKISRQTYEHFIYTPSKPIKFEFACIFPTAVANLRARAGCFTTSDGFFLEQTGTTVNIVRRTNVTGTPADNAVAQASWNFDPLDGTGPSGKTLDLTKINLVFIEYLWYGAGPARIGFEIDGEPIIAHQFNTTNTLSAPLTSTGNFPLRYEIENIGLTSVTSEMKTYGASVTSEGGETQKRGYLVSQSSGSITAGPSTRTHAITIRPRTTFGGITNRAKFELESVQVLVTGADPVKWEIVYGQALTAPTFTDVNATNSAFQYATGETLSGSPSIVGPTGFAAASQQVKGSNKDTTTNVLPVCLDAAGAVRNDGTIGVLVQSTAVGSSACRVVLNWREVY